MKKRKGDVNRFILLLVILLILSLFIIWLYYVGIVKLVQTILEKRPR